MDMIKVIRSIFSLDTVIYLSILFVWLVAMARCLTPLASLARRLRRAARVIITENKQNKEKKSWNDIHFLGDRLEGTWADFLQNAELRDAHGESCDVTQYINEDTVIYAAGVTRLAEITPGILTSLGILGTFLGLVMGLSGLNLNAADTSALLAAMEKLIGGMSTAFLTSIAGVVASIIFNLLNTHYTNKCQKAIDRFCEVFSLYALPKPVSQESAMLALAQEQTAYIRQAVEEVSEKMAKQIESSIMRAMLPVQRSMDNFILVATREQVEGVDRIAQVFVQRMNAALGNEFDHLRRVLRENSAEQQKLQQDMRAATEAIAQMTQDVVNMHQLSQGVLEHFRDYVTDMNASRAQVDETNQQTVQMLDRLAQSSAQQAVQLAKLQEYQKTLENAGKQHAQLTDQLIAGSKEQVRLMEKTMEQASSQMRESAKTLTAGYDSFTRQTQETLRNTTQSFDESITASIRQMNETLAAMRETTRSMPQMLTQSRDRYSEQVDQFVTALVRLQKSMEKVSAAAEDAAAKRKE